MIKAKPVVTPWNAFSRTPHTPKEIHMPTVTNPNLTLTTVDDNTTLRVTYTATFSEFERRLAGLGMKYHAHITAHGVDFGTDIGPSIETVDAAFGRPSFAVTDGTGDQVINHDKSATVPRSQLQEDPDLGNADELQ
jgi:hypothetical protein